MGGVTVGKSCGFYAVDGDVNLLIFGQSTECHHR